jgi:hypothetical protein
MVEENPTAKAVEPEAARKDWAEVADDDEDAGDQVIGQESAAVEEKAPVAVSKKPAGPAPKKNKYGDFVVTKIAVRDPRDKAGKEFEEAEESSGEEESEDEESEEEPEKKAEEVVEPKKSKCDSHVFATILCRGAC